LTDKSLFISLYDQKSNEMALLQSFSPMIIRTQGDVMSHIRIFVLLCTFLTIFFCAAGKISLLPSADGINHSYVFV